jgi:hypothetical protein
MTFYERIKVRSDVTWPPGPPRSLSKWLSRQLLHFAVARDSDCDLASAWIPLHTLEL